MKNHKFQQIRIRINAPGDSVRFAAETDKLYAKVRGVFASVPSDQVLVGATMGLKINGQDVFDDAHEVRMITCGNQVAPNNKFFRFEEHIEAGGASVEGRYTDPTGTNSALYPYDVKLYLWLVNELQSPEKPGEPHVQK
jgi:hypothetical protein